MIDFLLQVRDTLLWGTLFSLVFLYTAFLNWYILFQSRWRKRSSSLMPFLGGLAGVLVVCISGHWKFFWIPLLFDVGCLPDYFITIYYNIKEKMKKAAGIECENSDSIHEEKHENETKITDFDFEKAKLTKPTFWQIFFAFKFAEYFIFMTVFLAITFCFYLFANSEEEKKALGLLGAFIGVFSAMIFQIKLSAHREKINGWPFCGGDVVHIIRGPHAGKIAQISKASGNRSSSGEVKVSIAGEPEGGIENTFRYLELIKLKTSFSKNETTP